MDQYSDKLAYAGTANATSTRPANPIEVEKHRVTEMRHSVIEAISIVRNVCDVLGLPYPPPSPSNTKGNTDIAMDGSIPALRGAVDELGEAVVALHETLQRLTQLA